MGTNAENVARFANSEETATNEKNNIFFGSTSLIKVTKMDD